MINDIRAIVYGLGTFLILHVGYLFLEESITDAFLPMMWLFCATPVLAGVTGYSARRQPFLSLLVLGVAVTICISVLHVLWSWLGLRRGAGDLSGAVTLGVFSLIFVPFAVVVGGAIGAFISRAHA